MAFGKINLNAISEKVMQSGKVKNALESKIKQAFDKSKREVIDKFLDSPVTKEIQAGPSSSNTSGTLGGYGNLFSYIGFYSGESPIEKVIKYLKNLQFKGRVYKTSYRKGKISASYTVGWYNLETIENLSAMPWELGNSWIRGIERGISGYSYYMYGVYKNSRSGKGRQSKNKVELAPTFSPRRYLPSIIKDAENKMK